MYKNYKKKKSLENLKFCSKIQIQLPFQGDLVTSVIPKTGSEDLNDSLEKTGKLDKVCSSYAFEPSRKESSQGMSS